MLTFTTIVSYLATAALGAALVSCAVRRWRLAVTISSSVFWAGVTVVVLLSGRFALSFGSSGPVGSSEPTMKAAVLAQSVSELMSCGVLPVLAALAAAVLWAVARRRLRSGETG
jgi:hypothetical protein